jgi:putative FmdB family regulatory protein
MPLYEYECDAGHRFELIRKFSDPPLETCPTCGAPVRKLFSSPAIQFKGSGFYITDYAKKDQTPASPPGDAKSDTESKDKEKGAPGEKSEKSDRAEKSEKSDKSEKSEKSSTTETAKPSTPSTSATTSDQKKDSKSG